LFYLSRQKNLKNLSILKKMDKSESAYKTIGEVAKILKLQVNKKGILPTHIIRFWETQFKQIKPKILNSNRRYYDEKTINLLKKVKFLLKDQGMTINGVKKMLNNEVSLKLDEIADKSIKAENLKNKLVKISKIIKELK
jgi:DNA-binding transcriptional MerR regulator